MKVIVGLGNPEKKYEYTYHNLGFLAADNVAAKLNLEYKLKSSLKCAISQGVYEGQKFLLVKPTTYMNLSGECVQKVLSFYGISPEDLLVIYDDIDIEIGQIRFRPHGSSGTHNGMRNISLLIGTNEFRRVRIGSKPRNSNIPLIDYVLSKINQSEYDSLNKAIDRAALCALDFVKGIPPDGLMQEYNKRIE